MRGLALIAAFLTAGCLDTDAMVTVPTADYDAFVSEVQPVLAERCGNPSCHGLSGRPLEVFAVHLHRLDPANVHRDLPLAPAELRANYLRASAFFLDGDRPEESPLLLKPLGQDAGGSEHSGGTQFADIAEADYRALLSWISEALR